MVKITIEDIVFWIIILFVIGVMIWMLFGSPTIESALITIGGGLISSEILLWKKFYYLDKRVALSFMRMKNNIEKIEIKMNNRFDKTNENMDSGFKKINNKLILNENKLNRKR